MQAATPDWADRQRMLTQRLWSLLYLPLFGATWLWVVPTRSELIVSMAGLALFLAIYIGSALSSRARIGAVVAVFAIGLGLAFFGGNWPVLAVYAATMAAASRPHARARIAVVVMGAITSAFALILGQNFLYGLISGFMVIMIGMESISRIAFEDANRALKLAQDEIRRLGALTERERIARDLHDLLGRSLTLIVLKADLAAKLALSEPPRAQREIADVARAARSALTEVRNAVSGMTRVDLTHELIRSRGALRAADVGLKVEGDPENISPTTGPVFAMVLREAVTNLIRHSKADHCWIRIEVVPGMERLVIADDGAGGIVDEGSGIAGMRARLADVGGDLELQAADKGTRLVASVVREPQP